MIKLQKQIVTSQTRFFLLRRHTNGGFSGFSTQQHRKVLIINRTVSGACCWSFLIETSHVPSPPRPALNHFSIFNIQNKFCIIRGGEKKKVSMATRRYMTFNKRKVKGTWRRSQFRFMRRESLRPPKANHFKNRTYITWFHYFPSASEVSDRYLDNFDCFARGKSLVWADKELETKSFNHKQNRDLKWRSACER